MEAGDEEQQGAMLRCSAHGFAYDRDPRLWQESLTVGTAAARRPAVGHDLHRAAPQHCCY